MDIPGAPDQAQDKLRLTAEDEEECINFVCEYMDSKCLLELEDQGVSQLLFINGMIEQRVQGRGQQVLRTRGRSYARVSIVSENVDASNAVHINQQATGTCTESITTAVTSQAATESQLRVLMANCSDLCKKLNQGSFPSTPPYTTDQPLDMEDNLFPSHVMHLPSPNTNQPTTSTAESMIALRNLPLLQRKEFKIHGGQIGDNISDISYSNVSKQIDQDIKEKHTEDEIIRAVFRVIKPGNFKEMLSSKDDMAISELKSFLQSHLGEKSSTELFQDLMNAKQHEHESPQQFLYRMMGLKQTVIFTSRQMDADIKYEAHAAQNVFLRTIYQGMSEKYDDVRREFRHLLSDPTVTDEALLKQVTKTTSEESERKRHLGLRNSRVKIVLAHSGEAHTVKTNADKNSTDTTPSDQLVEQLTAQVQALTKVVNSLQSKAAPTVTLPPVEHKHQHQCACQCPIRQAGQVRRDRL